jgi:murein DD-endopeptidase MepM/ murein hydrolase activator NlpD
MFKSRFILLIALFGLLFLNHNVFAQSEPAYPIYIVQAGDTLSSIAYLFDTTVNDILAINEIQNPDSLAIGASLNIPGFEGVSGILDIKTIRISENMSSICKSNQISADMLATINRITSPEELFIGSNLIVPVAIEARTFAPLKTLPIGQAILDLAIAQDLNYWDLVIQNNHHTTFEFLPGEIVYSQSDSAGVSSISSLISEITISPSPLYQGATVQISVTTDQPMTISGSLGDYNFSLFQLSDLEYVGLQGIGAQENIGLTPIRITGVTSNGDGFDIQQNILIYPMDYGQDGPVTVDPITIDPDTIAAEDEIVHLIVSQATPEKQWSGVFRYPLDEPCMGSGYGLGRIYNNLYTYYHTGVDFTVCSSNTNIYASAPGIVRFSAPQIVRGNAVLIDHGWGVYTGYYHMSEILVSDGDFVDAGQVIGYVGNTGRSSGYHLHWEVWVNGIQVEPFSWLNRVYPSVPDLE